MSLSGSRRPSADDDVDDDSKEFHSSRKDKGNNPDSGFHEDKEIHSNSSSSTVSGKTDPSRIARRRPETLDSSGGHSGETRHSNSHDSIITIASENQVIQQDFLNHHQNNSASGQSNKSDCSTNSSGGGGGGSSRLYTSQQRRSTLDKEKVDGTVINYDIPSDTELSEIIAIMSGLATPRNPRVPPTISNSYDDIHKAQTAGSKFFNHGSNDEEFRNYHYDDSVARSRHAGSMPSIRRPSTAIDNFEMYDRKTTIPGANKQFNGVANGVISNNNNSKVRNGNAVAGRRYLQKQQWSKSVDIVSVSGSTGGSVSDLNYGKSTPISLNSILAASKSGTLGPNGKKNKRKKPKIKGPPKKEEEVMSEYSTKTSWKQRLKFFLTFLVSVTLILSGSSLLFVVPIVVDPILVGLEAQFSALPAQCRTISKRNGTGALECTIPSCREGCTADLVTCYFIEVEYQLGTFTPFKNGSKSDNILIDNDNSSNITFESNDDSFNNNSVSGSIVSYENDSPSSESMGFDQYFTPQSGLVQNGTLLININGCGYPPEINCTEFEKKYSEVNTTFPCHYSQTNESIVVPAYSRHGEIMLLSISLIVPLGTCLVCAILLYLLLRWNPKPKRNKRKVKEKDKETPPPTHSNHVNNSQASTNNTRKQDGEDGNVKLRLSPTPNEKVNHGSKPIGILSSIVGDLTGISSQNVMKKRHYAKFNSSFSNSDSQTNSRCGSTVIRKAADNGLDMELDRIESADISRKILTRTDDDDGNGSGMRKSVTSTTFVDNYDYYDINEKKDSSLQSSSRTANFGMANGYVPSNHHSTPHTTISGFDKNHKLLDDDDRRKVMRQNDESGSVNHTSTTSLNKNIRHVEGDLVAGLKNYEISLDSPKRNHPSFQQKLSTKNPRRLSVASTDSIDSDSVKTLSFGKL